MKKATLFLLCVMPVFVNAQPTNIDSLVNVLNTQSLSDDKKVELYLDISKFYSNNNYDSCIMYSNRGMQLAEKSNNKRQIAAFYNFLGLSYYLKESFDTSVVYLDKYLDLAIKLKDKELEMSAYGSLGSMNRIKNDYHAAIEYYMKALAVSDTVSRMRAILLVNTGTVYRMIQHWELAAKYLEDALTISKKLNLSDIEMGASHTLGNVFLDKQMVDTALVYYEKSLELSRKLSYKHYELISTQSIGICYSILKNYDLAIKYGNEALTIAEDIGNAHSFISSWIAMSEIYLEAKQYKNSEEMALKAWAVDSTSLSEGAYAAYNLTLANIHLGNKQKAGYFISKFREIMFSGNDKQMKESLANMEVKYQTEKKETRIATLEKERKLYIELGIAVILILLLAIGLLFYRHRAAVQKRKMAEQQIKQLEQEKELVIARAALDAEKAEREIIARDLHDGVGAMLSVVKNNMNILKTHPIFENTEPDHFNKALDGIDKSIVELRRVAHHIMPAMLIEKGLPTALEDFCRSIPEAEFHCTESERRFDHEKELVLYRCAYELVNNALRHAGASRIDVHLNMDEKTVYLSVVDNGCGFDPQTTSPGMGLNNIRIRLSAFGGHIDIYSDRGKGTEVNVELGI